MKNELSDPAWSGYEQDIPVAQETANDLENVTCAGLSNADERHAAFDKLVNVALEDANYKYDDNYDEYVIFCGTQAHAGLILKAARAYTALQKGV